MIFSRLLLLVTAALTISAVPGPKHNQKTCTKPLIRKEWRALTAGEKKDYLRAVVCLQRTPGILKKYPTSISFGAETLFEDFVTEHKRQRVYVHWTGQFLAWHRLFLWEYEKRLREKCGYKGAQPYWDMRLDFGQNLLESPMFNGTLSFGGNGPYDPNAPLFQVPPPPITPPGAPTHVPAGGCVQDGPFVNWNMRVAKDNDPAPANPPDCLRRSLKPEWVAIGYAPGMEDWVLQAETGNFAEFDDRASGTPPSDIGVHIPGHAIFGSSIASVSNYDPLFYLHHANLDRLWAKWQKLNPENVWAVAGPVSPRVPEFYEGPPLWKGNATLRTEIHVGKLAGGKTFVVGQFLDTEGLGMNVPGLPGKKGKLCFKYEE